MISLIKSKKKFSMKNILSKFPKPSESLIEKEKANYEKNSFVIGRILIALFIVMLMGTFTISVLAENPGSSKGDSGPTLHDLSIIIASAATNHCDELSTQGYIQSGVYTSIKKAYQETINSGSADTLGGDWAIVANLIGMKPQSVTTGQNGQNSSAGTYASGNAKNENNVPIEAFAEYYDIKPSATDDANNMYARAQRYWSIGKMLQDSGIREYATANNDTSNSFRPLIGYTSYFLYVACMSANSVFSTCLRVASNFDLIGAFENAGNISIMMGGGKTYNGINTEGINAITNAILQSDFLRNLAEEYRAISGSIKFLIFAIYILGFITTLVLLKPLTFNASLENKKRGRDLAVRIMVMFAGVPLIMMLFHIAMNLAVGVTYSTNNDAIQNTSEISQAGSFNGDAGSASIKTQALSEKTINKYVLSVFCNYENVVNSGYYAEMPADITLTYVYQDGKLVLKPTDEAKLATYVYCLNGVVGTSPLDAVLSTGDGSATVGQNIRDNYDIGAIYDGTADSADTNNTMDPAQVRTMLLNYADGDIIPAGLYDGALRSYNNYLSDLFVKKFNTEDLKSAKQTMMQRFLSYGNSNAGLNAEFSNSAFYATHDKEAPFDSVDSNELTIIDGHVSYNSDDDFTYSDKGEGDSIGIGTNSDFRGFTGIPVEIDGTDYLLYGDILHVIPYSEANAALIAYNVQIKSVTGDGGPSGSDPSALIAYSEKRRTTAKTACENGDEVIINIKSLKAPDSATSEYHIDNAFGLSTLGLYNMYYTEFTNTGFTVYDPEYTSNNSVGMQLYSVSIVGNGLKELIHVIYLDAVLFAFAVIGWVLGFTTLANIIVESVKIIPQLFKMMVGSINGFGNALAIVLTLAAEILATMIIYSYSISILDFGVKVIGGLLSGLTSVVDKAGGGTATSVGVGSFINSLGEIAIAVALLYMAFMIIKWRKAIVTWFKATITAVLNKVFQGAGIKAPEGAEESGMMGKLAMAGAGLAIAGGMAGDGTLDDVVNDLSNSKLGQNFADNYDQLTREIGNDLANGDLGGAVDKLKGMASVGGLNAMTGGYAKMKGTLGEDGKVRDDKGNVIEGATGVDEEGYATDENGDRINQTDENGNYITEGNGLLGDAGMLSGVGNRGVNENEFAESQLEGGTDELDGSGTTGSGADTGTTPKSNGLTYNANGYTDAQQAEIDQARAEGKEQLATDLENKYDEQNFGKGGFLGFGSPADKYREAYSAGQINSDADIAQFTKGGDGLVTSSGDLTGLGQQYLTTEEQQAYGSGTLDGTAKADLVQTVQNRAALAQSGGYTQEQTTALTQMINDGATADEVSQQMQTYQVENFGSVANAQQMITQATGQTQSVVTVETSGGTTTLTSDFASGSMTMQTGNVAVASNIPVYSGGSGSAPVSVQPGYDGGQTYDVGYNNGASLVQAAPSYSAPVQSSGRFNNLGQQQFTFAPGNSGGGSGSAGGSSAPTYDAGSIGINEYSADYQKVIQDYGIDLDGNGALDAAEQSRLKDTLGSMNS